MLGVQLAKLQVVHRALSCPQKNLRCFYTATATESYMSLYNYYDLSQEFQETHPYIM